MLLDNFLIAAEQVAILYLLVAVGFIADRTKLFTEKAARLCTDLMFYIITPAKIVQSFISMEFSRESATRLAIAAACGAAGRDRPHVRPYRFCGRRLPGRRFCLGRAGALGR